MACACVALVIAGCSSADAAEVVAQSGGTAGALAGGGVAAAGGGVSSSGGAVSGADTGGASTAGVSGTGGAAADAGAGGVSVGGGGGGAGNAGSAGTAGSVAIPPNQVEVFLIAGQSNATGQGYTKNIPASFTINTKVQLYHSADIISGAAANTWIPLRHASEAPDKAGDRFGPELGFGTNIQALLPDRQIALIKHAVSATNLVSQWAPGSSATDTAHFGPQFKTFVATVDGGLKALKDKGLQPVIRGMLWQQGENDADLGGDASAKYGEHLAALIARVREQWQTPSMLFVYGYVYPKSNYGTGRDQVRQGEANVDQDSGNALAVQKACVVLTDDLSLRADDPGTPYPSDLIHFGTAGQLELGKRMAQKTHDKLVF